jgi:hypothetical protein
MLAEEEGLGDEEFPESSQILAEEVLEEVDETIVEAEEVNQVLEAREWVAKTCEWQRDSTPYPIYLPEHFSRPWTWMDRTPWQDPSSASAIRSLYPTCITLPSHKMDIFS